MNNMNIKHGELFEWVFGGDNVVVPLHEELYSYTMEKYVPCGGWCLCIRIENNIIHWISDKGLFHAHAFVDYRVRPLRF